MQELNLEPIDIREIDEASMTYDIDDLDGEEVIKE